MSIVTTLFSCILFFPLSVCSLSFSPIEPATHVGGGSYGAKGVREKGADIDLETVLDRLIRLEKQHQQEKQVLEKQVQKLQTELDKQSAQQERNKKELMQRTEWLELRYKKMEAENDKMSQTESGQKEGVESPSSQEDPIVQQRKRNDDFGALEPVVTQMSQRLNEVTAEVQSLKDANVLNELGRGSAYVHWGSTTCRNASETVYSGYIGGSYFAGQGGAANHLCLPPDPTFNDHAIPRYSAAEMFGAEYETCDQPECDETVVCSVCRIPRATTVMVPGKNSCWAGWTKEYSGYIMANLSGSNRQSSEYICVDGSLQGLPGSKTHDDNGNLIYFTKARCGSLPCPPYVEGKTLQCVVCSK